MIFNIFYFCLLKKQLEKYRQGFLNILIINTFVVLKKEYLIILYGFFFYESREQGRHQGELRRNN